VNWNALTAIPRARWVTGALAVSALVALVSLVRAVRLEAVPDAPPLVFETADALAPIGALASVDIRAAVENDVFATERSAPSQRYRIPGEGAAEVHVAPIEPPKPVVLGIALADATHSFATCMLDGGPPTILHVGSTIGEYTVKSIERGRVTFTTAEGKKFEIHALKPGSQP
jgi:hypothetical protein